MWAIIPAAGKGSRIQPLAFSKELLPVGLRKEHGMSPRPVSDYLIERLVRGGASRLCFVIAPGKSDIVEYYGGSAHTNRICYAVQPKPLGLCDAIFRAVPFVDLSSPVLVGLPDTIWFPADALTALPDDRFSLLLFPVEDPEHFDSVLMDQAGRVERIDVKSSSPQTNWVWGAFKFPGTVLRELYELWLERDRVDEYFGTLANAWIDRGGTAFGVRAGTSYLDVGTTDSYLRTLQLLNHSTEVAGSTM